MATTLKLFRGKPSLGLQFIKVSLSLSWLQVYKGAVQFFCSFQSSGEGKKVKVVWGLRNRSPPCCAPISLPAYGEITEETLLSLDLRNGLASIKYVMLYIASVLILILTYRSDSPTPLKRQGPCEFDGRSPPRHSEKNRVNWTFLEIMIIIINPLTYWSINLSLFPRPLEKVRQKVLSKIASLIS